MMQYKGYVGHAEYDDDAGIFHGEVVGINDVVTFQGTTVEELRQAFRDSVDEYLAFCARRGEEPNKPFSGQLRVRLGPELHRRAAVAAKISGQSLNTWIIEQIERGSTAV